VAARGVSFGAITDSKVGDQCGGWRQFRRNNKFKGASFDAITNSNIDDQFGGRRVMATVLVH